MLSREAEAAILDLDGSGAPKMVRPAIGAGLGREPPFLGLFGDGRQGYAALESTPAGPLAGEGRLTRTHTRRKADHGRFRCT
jgi:hypothetical protein